MPRIPLGRRLTRQNDEKQDRDPTPMHFSHASFPCFTSRRLTEIWKMEDDSSEQSGGLSYADKNQEAFARFSFNLHFEKLYVVVSSPSHCLSSSLRFLNGVITPLAVYVNQNCYRSRGTERMGSLTTPESEVAAVAGPCPVSVLNPGLDRSAIWRFSRSIRNTNFLAS